MKQYTNPVPQYFDNDGDILSAGSIGFYENGSTTTKKNTYNADGGVLNTNPVVLSAEGRLPQVWGDGLYTVICRKKPVSPYTDPEDGEVVWTRHGYEFATSEGQFGEWNANENYDLNDIRKYGGNYYLSEASGNIGNVPDVSTDKWSQIAFLGYWNEDKPNGYDEDAIVIKNGYLYRSLSDDNTADPEVSGWENLTFNNSITGDLSVSGNLTVGGGITSSHSGSNRRSSTLSITTDTTLSRDTDLTVTGLATGWYFVQGAVVWNSNSGGAANGLQITLDADSSTALQKVCWQNFTVSAVDESSSVTTPVFENAGYSDNTIVFSGMVRLDTGSSLGLWVAQSVSSATAIEIKYGSINVIRVGDGV